MHKLARKSFRSQELFGQPSSQALSFRALSFRALSTGTLHGHSDSRAVLCRGQIPMPSIQPRSRGNKPPQYLIRVINTTEIISLMTGMQTRYAKDHNHYKCFIADQRMRLSPNRVLHTSVVAPAPLARDVFKIACKHELAADHTLAFAMALHPGLGTNCSIDPEIVVVMLHMWTSFFCDANGAAEQHAKCVEKFMEAQNAVRSHRSACNKYKNALVQTAKAQTARPFRSSSGRAEVP